MSGGEPTLLLDFKDWKLPVLCELRNDRRLRPPGLVGEAEALPGPGGLVLLAFSHSSAVQGVLDGIDGIDGNEAALRSLTGSASLLTSRTGAALWLPGLETDEASSFD